MAHWNFRRGVDWGTDPSGNTVLPNHVFVDGIQGDDVNTGLDPSLPLKTITQAKALYASTYTIVCAPARYVDQYGNVGSGETYRVIGDSEDDDIVMIDSVGNRTGVAAANTENIVLSGYLNGVVSVGVVIKCTFIDCNSCETQFLRGCRFINSPLIESGGAFQGNLQSCMLLNSPVTVNKTGFLVTFAGCYIDQNSTLNIIDGNVLVDSNHFEDKLTWDVAGVTYNISNTDGNPFINDIGLLNYTIDPVNSPLFGRGYPDGFVNPRHLARFYIGTGFYAGLTAFDDAILLNPNLNVVGNELLNVGPNNIEFLETHEVVLSSLQALGIPHKVGILTYLSTVIGTSASLNNLDRALEIRYASTDAAPYGPYKKYRFGEQVTNNTDLTSNGEETYSWADNKAVFVKKFQIRIGIVKGGVI